MSVISPELDFQFQSVSHATYEYTQISPQSVLEVIPANVGTISTFEIAPMVLNMGRSVLSCTLTPDSSTDTLWAHVNGNVFVNNIRLQTRSNVTIAEITDCNRFLHSVSRRTTKNAKMTNNDVVAGGDGNSGFFEGLFKTNTLTSTTLSSQVLTAATTPFAVSGTVGGAVTYATTSVKTNVRPSGANATKGDEPQYLLAGVAGQAAKPIIKLQIPLSEFVHSAISIDRDQFFGETVLLKITWSSVPDIYFKATNALSPVTGAAASAGTIGCSELYLYAAQEQNSLIIEELRSKYEKGELKYQIEHVTTFQQTITNSDVHSIQVRMNRLMGSKLHRSYWVPYSNYNATNNRRYDNINNAGSTGGNARITSFYENVNNKRLQPFDYRTSTGNEWLTIKDRLKGSCILSSDDFLYNYCHLHMFTGGLSTDIIPNLDQGKSLDEELIYSIQAQVDGTMGGQTNNLHHYIFAVTQRELFISPQGIIVQ
eukprot:Lithocolla_globosa_v1_NODE_3879_length_1559_cov_11.662899.p1 type:complete len:483 gc:universal NODE_3879_length_1559_cov_11.662899:91-1539(+)